MATQPTSVQQDTTNIPQWATPYAQYLLGNVFGGMGQPGLIGQGYQPYGKQRTAGFSPLQQQAMEGIAGMQVSPELGIASGMAGMAGRRAGRAGQRYERMATDPFAMGAFMSPYIQNVIQQQKRGAMQDYARQIPGLQAAGIRTGGRGGTREALLQAEANRNLQNQLQGIEATGLQNAFQNAQQAQQFGANLGLQGLAQQLAAAGSLGGLGMQGYQQRMGIGQAQLGAGAQGQALEQELLNQQYQDFINQQQFPYKQAEFGMGLLRGMPTDVTRTMYQQAPSIFNQIAGPAMMGLGGLMFGGGGR
jgi:hypothetical protein